MSIDVDQMASVVEKPRKLGRHIVSTYTSLMCLNHIFFDLRILGYSYINTVARQEKEQKN